MSANPEVRSSNTLNLSSHPSLKHHTDESSPPVSKKVKGTDTCSQNLVTTYNGVPRELLRKAQKLLANEIRLLDLAPGTHGDPLAGSLRKVQLSDAIVYEPLSYTWNDYGSFEASDSQADPGACPAIFLENVESFIWIGTNCEKALRSVRKATTERTIWVDSICVNQDDPEERSRQVDLMQRIFARAFTVLIYLGQESREQQSSLAMSLLGKPDRLRHVDGLDQNERRSLKHLFERPYFRRMWIVQEVALAQTLEIHCGPASTYLSTFAGKPLEAIFGAKVSHPPWLKHSKHANSSLRKPSIGSAAQQILTLIFDTASCQCKDDRDRIFALFSLLDSGDKGDLWGCLSADYNKTTVQVYTQIAAYIAVSGFAWAVLVLSPRLARGDYSGGLPSWVPNWKALGNAVLEAHKLLGMISAKNTMGGFADIDVARSSVITIRGRILGPITPSKYSQDYIFEQRARMHQNRSRNEKISFFNEIWESGESRQWHENYSVWTLTKPTQSLVQDSWKCHLEFVTQYEPPGSTQHIAVMLPDNLTVLILRVHDDSRDHHTLAESGMPVVWGVVPEAWAWEDHQRSTEISLQMLGQGLFDYSWLQRSAEVRFSRLREYPELWSYNPATSAMNLTYRALEQARSTDLTALSLWSEWKKCARSGIQILRDKTCLQLLIDEVDALKEQEYRQIEVGAGLDQSWSLSHFLGLFIKDPLATEPMEWPELQISGVQTPEETAMLLVLMQWAEITYRFLKHFQPTVNYRYPWLNHKPFKIEDLYADAMAVACSHWSTAPVTTKAHEASDSGRASFLLRKILRQSWKSPDLGSEQERSSCFEDGRYWDWKRFDFVVEERLSFLRHVRQDIEDVQEYFQDDPLDFGRVVSHQILAAHGVDLTRSDLMEIRIG